MKYLGLTLLLAGILPGLIITIYGMLSTYTALLDAPLATEPTESAETLIPLALRVTIFTAPIATVGLGLIIVSCFRQHKR